MTDTNYQAMKKNSEGFFSTIKGALDTEKDTINLDSGRRKVKIRKDNLKLIIDHLEEAKLNKNIKSTSMKTSLFLLVNFTSSIKKPLKEADKEDILEFLRSISNKSPAYINSYKIRIKVFFKWLYGSETPPDAVSWIKTKKPKSKIPEILTQEEIQNMIENAENFRDKALISVGYESACRASELLELKIKDIMFDEYGATTIVDGKTGQRKVRLIFSVPDLKEWINHHPFKSNPDSPLFVNFRNKKTQIGMKNCSFGKMLKKTASRSRITKNVHPHLLRHSRLTELAKQGYTEQELNVIAGWTKDSSMSAVYVHLNSNDIDEKMLRNAGLLNNNENRKVEIMKPAKCPKCNKENSIGNDFCSHCYAPLTDKATNQIDIIKQSISQYIAFVMKKKGIDVMDDNLMNEWTGENG